MGRKDLHRANLNADDFNQLRIDYSGYSSLDEAIDILAGDYEFVLQRGGIEPGRVKFIVSPAIVAFKIYLHQIIIEFLGAQNEH